ncbi:MAG TPA: hypothetical protein VE733_01605 [Streptosporangiaceae bacterium]|nr:hypothetical protein [Streptosporangiaceae bacterium]
MQRFLDAMVDHDTTERLPLITAPTLVLAGGLDTTSSPRSAAVAERIAGARFEVMAEEAPPAFPESTRRMEHPRRCVLARPKMRT